MAQARKATRNAVGGELSEQQVKTEFTKIRDGPQRIKQAAARRTIKEYFEVDDIEVTSMKVSLTCPISKTRVKVPVRSVNCRHLECFDLRSYLNYHQLLTFWECPFSFCKAQARCDKLRVDEYMSDVLRTTDDRVQEVEVFGDGSFKAVQRPAPTETAIIDDDEPYVPGSGTKPIVKNEPNDESPVEPMDTDAFPTDQDQPHASSLAAGDDVQLREALRESRQHEPLSSLAAGDAAEAAIDGEPSAQGQVEHDDFSSSDASMSLDDLSEAPAMENDSDEEEPPKHASKPRKKQRGRFACTECGRRFYKSSVLSQHQRTHSGLKPYQCGQCDKEFNYYVSLRTHMSLHTGNKPYKCGHCDKAFAIANTLRTHQRIHSGEKHYECGQCGKRFTNSSTCRRHEGTHTVAKPYQCSQCGKAFTCSNTLRTHQRIHTGEKAFACFQCGTAFNRSSHLRRH